MSSQAPPTMAPWNLALRFGLELAALTGLALAAWDLTSGPLRWAAVVGVPVAAAALWVVFNVVDDPSRSGAAPVEVPGWVRLILELAILGGGSAGFAIAGQPLVALLVAALVIAHYLTSTSRLAWLVTR